MLNGLDLFSGIGGISIALSDWVRPIAYCEIDPYCQAVLLSRQHEGKLHKAPIWDDVRTIQASVLPSTPNIICGGFACQDISVAGNGKGLDGERSGLYWEIYRLAKEIKPHFIFLENVPAICTKGGWEIVSSLTEIGYGCRWCTLSAAQCGALHKREGWFLLANSKSQQQDGLPVGTQEGQPSTRNDSEHKTIDVWQKAVSEICRTTDGIPFRVDRIRGLGNAVVPIQAKTAFKYLMGIE